jgi:hypothetical protein
MRRLGDPAWKKVLLGGAVRSNDSGGNRLPGLFSDFELHRSVRLALHDMTMARGRMVLPWAISQTRKLTKSQPRNLLSVAGFNRAKSRVMSLAGR